MKSHIAEYVSLGHPDRLADAIVESIVDLAVGRDVEALVGVECAVHTDHVFIDGRIAAGGPQSSAAATCAVSHAEIEEIARKNAVATGGSFKKCNSMQEAFQGADIVYPKSWAPFAAMEERTRLYQAGDKAGIDALEKKLLAQNAEHKDWACTEDMMKLTKDGKALYLHCLPADITGLSCEMGEVDNSVFDRYRVPLYKQASYKPYIIAAMIFLAKVKDPVNTLMALDASGKTRKIF